MRGQLGDGSYSNSSMPVKVAGGHAFVSLGESIGWHTCGITTAREQADQGWPPQLGLCGNCCVAGYASVHHMPTITSSPRKECAHLFA